MFSPGSRSGASPARHAAALLLLVLLTAAHTWPLLLQPASLRIDHPDAMLNAWIVSWVGHGLASSPLELFDANAFYPAEGSLAYGEPLLTPGALGAPVVWAGASANLAHNLVWLAGFLLSAAAMYALAHRLTGSVWAALLGASVLVFNTHTLSRLPQLAAIWILWLPLALLALESLLTRARLRNAVWLGACVGAAALTSGHLALFTLVAVAVSVPVRLAWPRHPRRSTSERGASREEPADAQQRPSVARRLGLLGLAAGVCLAVAAPVLVAYAGRTPTRPFEVVAGNAASPAAYLATISALEYPLWGKYLYPDAGDVLFPGLIALMLAIVGGTSGRSPLRRRHVAQLLAVGAAGLVLSLGPMTPLYGWLYEAVPPLRSIRVPSRFGLLVILAVALLAAGGLAALLRGLRSRGVRRVGVIAAVLVLVANAEAWRPVEHYVPHRGWSPVYETIREAEEAVVAEFPFHGPATADLNAKYLMASTIHWKPLVNGFNGAHPDTFPRIARRLGSFPEAGAIRFLRRLGVTHVVVHTSRYRPARAAGIQRRLAEARGIRRVQQDPDGTLLYRLRVRGGGRR